MQRYNTRLADIHTKAVSTDLHNSFSLDVKLEGKEIEGLQVKVVMKDAGGGVVREEGKRVGEGEWRIGITSARTIRPN